MIIILFSRIEVDQQIGYYKHDLDQDEITLKPQESIIIYDLFNEKFSIKNMAEKDFKQIHVINNSLRINSDSLVISRIK